MKIFQVGALIAVATLLVSALPAAAASKSGTCNPTRVSFVTSSSESHSTNSTTYVNLPEAAVTFTQGGTTPSCVIVTFSAMFITQGSGAVFIVRALLDGNKSGLPNGIQYNLNGPAGVAPVTYTFVFPSVAKGNHTARIQFLSTGSSPQTITLARHNTLVQYAP